MSFYRVEFKDTTVGPIEADDEGEAIDKAVEIVCRRKKVVAVTEVRKPTKVRYG